MITMDDFGEMFMRILDGQMAEMIDAVNQGRDPELTSPGELVGTLWTVCQPDVTVLKLDVTDRVKALPGSDHVETSQLFLAYNTETKEPLVLYLDGHSNESGRPPAYFADHLTEMLRPLLLDEYGLEPKRVNEMLGEPGLITGMDRAFTRTVERELTEEEEAAVTVWREEINDKIDSIFKHRGGDQK